MKKSRQKISKPFRKFENLSNELSVLAGEHNMKFRTWENKKQNGFTIHNDGGTFELSVFWPEKGYDTNIGFHTNMGAPSWHSKSKSKIKPSRFFMDENGSLNLLIRPIGRSNFWLNDFCSVNGINETLCIAKKFIFGPSHNDVLDAISRFSDGERQEGRGQAKSWFVQGEDGEFYPAKHIWGLATGVKNFQTHTKTDIVGATVGLKRLGFNVVNCNENDGRDDFSYWENLLSNTVKSTTSKSNGQKAKRTIKNKNLEIPEDRIKKIIQNLRIKQKGRCALTGLKLNFTKNGGDHQLHPSIDRIDSSGHYSEDNIQIVCKFVNFWKQAQKDDEFRRLLSIVRGV